MEQELSDNDQVVEWARGVADLLDDEAEEELMLEEAFAESSRPKKRRKSSGTSSTKQRAPQKMFYQEQVEHGPLTTNIARQVEMLDPREANMLDCIPLKVFKSCSDAARETGINRTKLSRTCRQGGGVIDQHYYRYKGTPASISCVPLKSHITSSAVASAASALDESSGCSTPCQGTPSSTIMHRPTAVTPARTFIYVLPRPANPMVSPYLNYTESPGAPL